MCTWVATNLVALGIGALRVYTSKPIEFRAAPDPPQRRSSFGMFPSPGERDAIAISLILQAILYGDDEDGVGPQHAARSPWHTAPVEAQARVVLEVEVRAGK
jgi:hypothetical protein